MPGNSVEIEIQYLIFRKEKRRVFSLGLEGLLGPTHLTNHTLHHFAIHLWADICALSDHYREGFHQLLLRIRLQQVSPCTGPKSAPQQFSRFVKSQQHYLDTRLRLSNGP